MSTDHRKPLVAFVVLALAAAAIVGIQRAEAQAGRFLAAVVGTSVRVQGTLTSDVGPAEAAIRAAALVPAFTSLDRALRGGPEPLAVTPAETAVAAHRADEPRVPAETVGRGRAVSSDGVARGGHRGHNHEAASDHGTKAGTAKRAGASADARTRDTDGADRPGHAAPGLEAGRHNRVERASGRSDRRSPSPGGWVRARYAPPHGSAR